MTDLTHLNEQGQAQMVDVTAKNATERFALASGFIRMERSTLVAIRTHTLSKGEALGVARLAGIMAAKRTAELIPLCHHVSLTHVEIVINEDDTLPGLRVQASARTTSQTGVEMEALCAVSVALMTVYDMAKAVDRGMTIGDIRLEEKSGGRTGPWVRP
ncbi:MAG: cyclic pyranopterin monophosphate synthase MoaC [Gemmatimonadota bacterium]|nr:cyclic pyranopterin monophosphate synthase MoaC [Gemmatimonadota bacterium]